MAFNLNNLFILTSPASSHVLSIHSYTSSTDNSATIKAANYFVGSRLNVGDLIISKSSDGVLFLQVTSVTLNDAGNATAITVVAFTQS